MSTALHKSLCFLQLRQAAFVGCGWSGEQLSDPCWEWGAVSQPLLGVGSISPALFGSGEQLLSLCWEWGAAPWALLEMRSSSQALLEVGNSSLPLLGGGNTSPALAGSGEQLPCPFWE